MKILIITAHPSENGFTHKIALRYKNASEKKGNEIEILNLYDSRLKQDFLNFQNIKEVKPTSEILYIQQKINSANELVFIFPIWWADAPAIFKNFFDNNFTPGFAYKYDKDGKFHPLLTNKTAKIFATCDGPGFFYKFPFISLSNLWSKAKLGFCGIKVDKVIIFDKMRSKTEIEKEKLLEKVSKIATK